jgi:transcriptional regulator with XRE-family HTH domain
MTGAAAPKPRRKATPAAKGPRVAARQATAVVDTEAVMATAGWRSAERAQFLVDAVGGVNKLAKTLGVSPSQPSRWKSGREIPSPEVAAKLLDLDHVVALAVQAWHPSIVMDWMTTANGFLEGAQPIVVLMQRGSAEVIDALKATLSGAYA